MLKKIIPISFKYMLVSTLAFSFMSCFVKISSSSNIPVFEIVAARAIVSLIISFIDIKRKNISVWGNNTKLLIARGLMGTFALIFTFYSIKELPLAEATIIQYIYPVFIIILSYFFLKEKIQIKNIFCIILSMIGLIIIVTPDVKFGDSSLISMNFSIIFAILGAVFGSIAYIFVKLLSGTEDNSVIIFYFPLIALPISLFLLGDDFILPNFNQVMVLILIGIFTQIGQVFLTKAFKVEDASIVTAYSYIQIIFSIVLGLLFFNELPIFTTYVGVFLILTGSFINIYSKSSPSYN